jgi:FHA domain
MEKAGLSRVWFLQSEPPGRLVVIDPLPFRVGRVANAQLILPPDAASREHAEILLEGEELRVCDLGSKNGTYVNGTRIQESPLHSGDMVQFGRDQFRIGALPGVRESALPGELDIYWNCALVGRVEGASIQTVECNLLEGVVVHESVRTANIHGRWVRLPGGAADAFEQALWDSLWLFVLVDGIDKLGAGQSRARFAWFGWDRGGEALLRLNDRGGAPGRESFGMSGTPCISCGRILTHLEWLDTTIVSGGGGLRATYICDDCKTPY